MISLMLFLIIIKLSGEELLPGRLWLNNFNQIVERVRFERAEKREKLWKSVSMIPRRLFPLVTPDLFLRFTGMISRGTPLKMFIYVRWDIDINLLNDAVGWHTTLPPPVSLPFIFVFIRIRVRARKYLRMETAGRDTIL